MGDETKQIFAALVKAQAEMKNPAFDSKNPHFGSDYASLASVRDTVLPVLCKHGIGVVQRFENMTGGVCVSTILVHNSGEKIDCGSFSIPVPDPNPQKYCSASTYARRFGLQAAVCVVGDTDDDGNGAGKGKDSPPPNPTLPIPPDKMFVSRTPFTTQAKREPATGADAMAPREKRHIIREVKPVEKKNKAKGTTFIVYEITLSEVAEDGKPVAADFMASTFSQSLAGLCENYLEQQVLAKLQPNPRNPKYWEIVDVSLIGRESAPESNAAPVGEEPPTTEDNLPF